jgi:enoyl-[acyl-carrier protein] reductase II
MPFHTALCDLLGINYPVIQGAIMHAGGPGLVAAVSNAGGLGVLSSAGISTEQLVKDIAETRRLCNRPFGVNIQAGAAEFALSRARIVIENGVSVVTLGRIDPRLPVIDYLRSNHIKIMAVVGNVARAKICEEQGVDIIIASGSEAGGHVGRVATMPLVPAVINAVKLPVVAAGGIADARGFVAALALGACGVQMGTRFYATREATAPEEEKMKIVAATEDGTIVSSALTGLPCRLISEKILDDWEQQKQAGATGEVLKSLSAEIQKRYWQKSTGAVVSAGQACGMISSTLSAVEVIEGIITESMEICRKIYDLSGGQVKARQ